ncbi:hypothetical protein [Synechococcus sp. Cruz CV-v-12]|uniref:hypothetical protein n=1 Tax=Synechococcus sp. Cruz CV-v-12 TaxID=2823728 RepID=UPI0020CC6EDB|nr:hypothetical protein [Synechococcus sp. Cruz CV-v-12]MCP9874364.1 hypothetical protein [Synechococcus sp. Cruz CV-v-12]
MTAVSITIDAYAAASTRNPAPASRSPRQPFDLRTPIPIAPLEQRQTQDSPPRTLRRRHARRRTPRQSLTRRPAHAAWEINPNNVYGTIVYRSAAATAGVSGSSGASVMITTDPNANFTF